MNFIEHQMDSLSVPHSTSRLHTKLLSSLGRASGRKVKGANLTRSESLSSFKTPGSPSNSSEGPPPIPLPNTPLVNTPESPRFFRKSSEQASARQQETLLPVSEERDPSEKSLKNTSTGNDTKTVRRSVSVGRVLETLRGKPGSVSSRKARSRRIAVSTRPSTDDFGKPESRMNPDCTSVKAGKLLGILDSTPGTSQQSLGLPTINHPFRPERYFDDSSSTRSHRSSYDYGSESPRDIEDPLDEFSEGGYPYMLSPTISEIEDVFESSFGSYQASAQSFLINRQSSPSFTSKSSSASTSLSSPPITPTSQMNEAVPMPQIICPEDREAYRISCLELLESLKAIEGLAQAETKEKTQPKLTEEVEEWEVRLKNWEELDDDRDEETCKKDNRFEAM